LIDFERALGVNHLDHAQFLAAPRARRSSVQRLACHPGVILRNRVQKTLDQPAPAIFEISEQQAAAPALDLDDAPV